jgi:Uma2 family endonuclease
MSLAMETPMSDSTAPRRFTYDDFVRLPDDGNRYEILWGELVVSPSPARRHQLVVARLTTALVRHLEGRDLGEWLPAPMDVVLADDSIVEPDLLFFRKGRSLESPRHGIPVAPDLAIEVVSDSSRRRDTVDKRRLYAEHGVQEYWIVDPEQRRVEVLVLDGDHFTSAVEATNGEIESPRVLPGLRVDLTALFA